MQFVKEDPPDWQDRKNNAANTAAENIISKLPEDKSNLKAPYASSESDDIDIDECVPYHAETIQKFADALKSNYIVDSSFHDVKESKYCYCPCSAKSHKWRDIFGVTGLSNSDECGKKSMTCQGILDHLKNVGKNPEAVLHLVAYKYLKNLWYDSDGNRYKFLDYDKKSVRARRK